MGQDYKSIELSLSEWSSGWQATIEQDEAFDVGLRPPRLYPDAQWVLVGADPSVVELVDESFVPAAAPDEPGASDMWTFAFRAGQLGSSRLSFEARADGERVAIAEYSVSVVEDACGADVGLTAARCQEPMPKFNRGWTEWDHGHTVQVGMDRATEVTLTAPALYPSGQWSAVDVDPGRLEVSQASVSDVRSPGDFDNQDTSKPDSFLPVWSFDVRGIALGETELTFEALHDGERVDVASFPVRVLESVEEGAYLVPPDSGEGPDDR